MNTSNNEYVIQITDTSLKYRAVTIDDLTPTGAQIAEAAGFKPSQSVIVLQLLAGNSIENIRPNEKIDLQNTNRQFIVTESDRTYFFSIDGNRFEWPNEIISTAAIRTLGNIEESQDVYQELQDTADKKLSNDELVNLNTKTQEKFVTRLATWDINVQGVIIKSSTPVILIKDALILAGFDPNHGWQIFLKVQGQLKQEKQLSDHVDLRAPGIEKLRLTQKQVDNGESHFGDRKLFHLLDVDENFLKNSENKWETIISENRRWLIIKDYVVPEGYFPKKISLALEIPSTYPAAQIDMFYVFPPLRLNSGREIDRTQVRAIIEGNEFHGWSRHRGTGSEWNPKVDNIITHLALVEGALYKEIE